MGCLGWVAGWRGLAIEQIKTIYNLMLTTYTLNKLQNCNQNFIRSCLPLSCCLFCEHYGCLWSVVLCCMPKRVTEWCCCKWILRSVKLLKFHIKSQFESYLPITAVLEDITMRAKCPHRNIISMFRSHKLRLKAIRLENGVVGEITHSQAKIAITFYVLELSPLIWRAYFTSIKYAA